MREDLSRYVVDGLEFHHSIDVHPNTNDYSMHAHEHYELFCFLDGKGTYQIEGESYTLEPGCILIMRPAETHRLLIDPNHAFERLVLEFSADILKPIDPQLLLLHAYHARDLGQRNKYSRVDFPHTLSGYISDLCADPLPQENMRLNIIAALINILNQINLAFASNTNEASNAHKTELSKALVDYINTHLFEDLSLAHLCEHFFYSDSHLGRVFKAATGSSIAEYISIKRLIEVRRRILDGVPPTVAAKECRYNDYSTFYRAYVKRFGVAPSDKTKFTPK